MNRYNTFGDLLQYYRTRLAGEWSRQEWLAKQLGYTKAVISKWETDDPSKALPSRETILKIGHLYSLDAEAVNILIEKARIGSKQIKKIAQYTPLSDEEIKT
jgi:DNA-binding XRE family transcriptional regulator